jgi:hypothetical protein
MASFAKTTLVNPVHQAILVGITDDKGPEFFEEVPNCDGFFQVIAGCQPKESDSDLTKEVYNILRRAAKACAFSKVDHEAVKKVFDLSEADVLAKGN